MTRGGAPQPIGKADFFAGFTPHAQPDVTAVRKQVEHICNSDAFVRSTNAQRLIRYLVESTLQGEQGGLKESVIGVEMFGRSPDFDPKTDSIVRVEMRRIRSKLSEYYLKEGANDDVLIWLDKGSYVPILRARNEQPSELPLALAPVLEGEPDTSAFIPQTTSSPIPMLEESHAPGSQLRLALNRRFWLASMLLVTATLIVGAFALFRFLQSFWAQSDPSLRLVPLTGNAGLEMSPSFSPNGREVAYAWDGNRRNLDIYVKQLGESAPHRLTDSAAHDVNPVWSPNGQTIAFLRIFPDKSQLITLPASGGVETVIREATPSEIRWHPDQPELGGGTGPAWSPDGSYLVMGATLRNPEERGLSQTFLSGKRTMLTQPPAGAVDNGPSFSPSGHYLAFVRTWGSSSGDIFVMPSRAGRPQRLTSDSRFIQGLAWLDEEHLIYSSNRQGHFRLWQISRNGGDSHVFAASGARPQWPAISADHHWLAFVDAGGAASIWRWSVQDQGTATPAEPFISSAGVDDSPAFSPDGEKVVFVSDRSGKQQLWVSNRDGTEIRQLADFPGSSVGSPHWSPDGRRIVFDGLLHGLSSIWLMSSDGSGTHRLNDISAKEYVPSWSRDGTWVYFVSGRSGNEQLWKQRPDSGEVVNVARQGFVDVAEHPAGELAFAQQPGGGIWQIPLHGGDPSPVPELVGVRPVRYWSLQGNKLYFVRQEQLPRDLDELDLQSRQIRKLTQIPGELLAGTPSLSIDPAAHTFLFAQKNRTISSILLQER